MKELTGFESHILESWEGWDGDQEVMQFYDAVLKVDTKNFKKGDKISTVTFLMNKSVVQFWDVENDLVEESKFKLELK